MKNIFKKVSAALLTLSLLTLSSGVNAFAKTDTYSQFTKANVSGVASKLVNPSPMYEKSCDASPSGLHEAYSRGVGVLYRGNGSLVYNNGCTWQCKYCGEVILTQGEVPMGQAIGYYATWYPPNGSPTSMYGTVLTTDNIYYSSGTSLAGFKFHYN